MAVKLAKMSLKAKLPIWVFVLVAAIGLATSFLLVNYGVSVLSEMDLQSLENAYWTKKISQKDTLANWQTHRNYEYGFEVKYPKDWEVELTNKLIRFTDTQNIDEIWGTNISPLNINIKQTEASSVEEWFDSEFSDRKEDLLPEYSEITINNVRGIKFSDTVTMGGCEEKFVFIKNSKLCIIQRPGATCNYSDKLFNQILSTFKFIEPIDTSDWKAYRNEEYGFEVKYPNDFVVEQKNSTINFHPLELNPSIFYPSITVFDETLEDRIQALKILFKISTSPFSKVISDAEIAQGNYGGRELIFQSEMGHEIRYVLLVHNSKIYQLEADNFNVEGLRDIVSHMLSTFKFIE